VSVPRKRSQLALDLLQIVDVHRDANGSPHRAQRRRFARAPVSR
jgi:hypothetical protein